MLTRLPRPGKIVEPRGCVRGRTDFAAARSHNYRNGGGLSIAGYARQSLSGNQFLYLTLFVVGIAVTLFNTARNAAGSGKEIDMNWDRIAGNWKQARDKNENDKNDEVIQRI